MYPATYMPADQTYSSSKLVICFGTCASWCDFIFFFLFFSGHRHAQQHQNSRLACQQHFKNVCHTSENYGHESIGAAGHYTRKSSVCRTKRPCFRRTDVICLLQVCQQFQTYMAASDFSRLPMACPLRAEMVFPQEPEE